MSSSQWRQPDTVRVCRTAWRHRCEEGRTQARQVLGLSGEERVVGWIGRLSPGKSPDLFLRLFAERLSLPRCDQSAKTKHSRLTELARIWGGDRAVSGFGQTPASCFRRSMYSAHIAHGGNAYGYLEAVDP